MRSGSRRRKSQPAQNSVTWIQPSPEAILLDDASVDTVLTLCSIPAVAGALKEARRVLKLGKLVFVEYGPRTGCHREPMAGSPDPFWKRVAGGCHLNRTIDRLIEASGFQIELLATGYVKSARLMMRATELNLAK